jgi:hypothetical protein
MRLQAMNTFHVWVLPLIATTAFLQLSGCRHLGSPEQGAGSSNYPTVNPTPSRIVIVSGSVSATLGLTLSATYVGNVSAGCWTSPPFGGGSFEGTARPLQVTVPLTVTRSSDRYSTSFAVDQFLPGPCGWHFAHVNADIQKGQQSSGPTVFIHAYEPGKAMETKTINSSDEPVTLRCRIRRSTGFNCSPPFGIKAGQWLVDTSQSVTANIIDAEGE